MKKIYCLFFLMIPMICFGDESSVKEGMYYEGSDLSHAWTMTVDKSSKDYDATPGKYIIDGNNILVFPLDGKGVLSKKPLKIPLQAVAMVPTASGYAGRGSPGYEADESVKNLLEMQTKLIINLTNSIGDLEKKISAADARIKVLEEKGVKQ